MVYRVSEASIRRALDTGRTAGELHALVRATLQNTCAARVLRYLIDDVARRHGQLRVGMAASFVRCEDPALLAQAVGAPAAEQLEMRLLAPTVAVSQAPISEVLAALRDRGLRTCRRGLHRARSSTSAPAAPGCPPPRTAGVPRQLTPPAGQTLSAIVAVLRKVAATPFAACGSTRRWPSRSCRRRPGCRTRW